MLLIHCRLSSSGDEDCWVVEMKNDGNERHRVKTDQQFDRRENCDIVFLGGPVVASYVNP